MPAYHFVSTSQERRSCEVPAKLSTRRILSVIFHNLYPTNIPSLPTILRRRLFKRKPREVSTTHPPSQRDLLILEQEFLSSIFFLTLSHCHTLRRDLYPNKTHTYSNCRECFGAQEAFRICQKKSVKLGRCNQAVLWDPENQ